MALRCACRDGGAGSSNGGRIQQQVGWEGFHGLAVYTAAGHGICIMSQSLDMGHTVTTKCCSVLAEVQICSCDAIEVQACIRTWQSGQLHDAA